METGATKQPAIFCDMCPEKKRKAAVKTCVKCEISMCAPHLQPHLTTPVLRLSHPLTEPVAPGAEGLGWTKCPQHGKLVEYYCLDDLTSVCVSCAIEDDHRLHNLKTISKAHEQLVEKLAGELRAVAARGPESRGLETWEKRQREQVSRSSLSLIDAISKMRDMALDRVRSSVSARTGSISTAQSSALAATGEKDNTFRFLQLYAQAHRDVERAKAVDLRKGLEAGPERDKLVQESQDVCADLVAQGPKLLSTLLMFVDPENHQEYLVAVNAKATFDPKTLATQLSLSADHKKVFYNNKSGALPHCILMIINSSIKKWTIAVSEHCDWTVGIRDNSFQGEYALSINSNDQMSSVSPVNTSLIPGAENMARPKILEMCWDTKSSSLSFFTCSSVHHQRRPIVSIDVSSESGAPLLPFVELRSKPGSFTQPSPSVFGRRTPHACAVPTSITEVLCELL